MTLARPRKVVFRVAVQFKDTHVNQRIILVRPDFREVKRVPTVGLGIFLRHDLRAEAPLRKIVTFDRFEQIPLGTLAVFGYDPLSFLVGPKLMALQGLKVEFYPEAFVPGVDEAVSVAAVAIDVPETSRQTSIRHKNRHLVERLG